MLEATNLRAVAGIRHGFFTREGGVSRGLFASLNCGFGSGDEPDNVAANRARALRRLDLEPGSLNTCHQIHSADVVDANRDWTLASRPQADAMVCREPGRAIGILTADCAPVLFTDAGAGVVGAAHAGWRGALSGILERTVEAMVECGARPASIAAAVGPCIHQRSYEVGPEFRDAFLSADPAHDGYFGRSDRPGHYRFDLPGFVVSRLEAMPLASVEVIPIDTYREENGFFSFRRATHRGEADYGRALSMIALENRA